MSDELKIDIPEVRGLVLRPDDVLVVQAPQNCTQEMFVSIARLLDKSAIKGRYVLVHPTVQLGVMQGSETTNEGSTS